MTASGTAGHGAELAAYLDLAPLGAVVVKSLSAEPWAGNPAPRVHETAGGDAQQRRAAGPGRARPGWPTTCPPLQATGATGRRQHLGPHGRRVRRGRRAAGRRARPTWSPSRSTVAARTSRRRPHLFAHDADRPPRRIAATAGCGRPRWAKLSPNVAGPGRHRRPRRPTPGPRPSRWSTPSSACARRRATPAPRLGDGRRRAVRAGHPPGRACGPSTTCTPPTRTCRSWASAGSPSRDGASSCCWPGRPRSRSARPPSPTRVRQRRVLDRAGNWCRRHGEHAPCAT